jgi:N utilization substance protein B
MTGRKSSHGGGRARSYARRLAMQALYQWQLTGQSVEEISKQFTESEEFGSSNAEYFQELTTACVSRREELDGIIGKYVDRPIEQLDPVEHSILLIGVYELLDKLEVPYKVAINEAVELAKKFGATDGHKYINALLDRAARDMRQTER